MTKEKYHFFYKPYLLVSLGLLIGYTFLNWLFFAGFEVVKINDIIVNWGIPIVLAMFCSWFIILPKLKLLELAANKDNWDRFYILISFVMLMVPLIIAQEYMSSMAGSKAELNSIREIEQYRFTRFFTVKDIYIHKNEYRVHSDFYISGKYGQDYNISLFFAVPIYENSSEVNNTPPAAWLGIQFRKTIKNKLSLQEKDTEYFKFFNESTQKYLKSDLNDYQYLKRLRESDFKKGIINAIKRKNAHSQNFIILQSQSQPFEERGGEKLSWLIGSYILGSILWFFMISIPKLNIAEIKKLKAGKLDVSAKNEINGCVEIIKPRKRFFVTPILIYTISGIFVLMCLKGYGFLTFRGENLISWGANYGPLVKNGQWYRLITNVFIHHGFGHILLNTIALVIVGLGLEPIIGGSRFILTFLITGIIASATSVWWNEAIISSGTTGAIYGLSGVLLVLLLSKNLPKSFNNFIPYVVFIPAGLGILIGLFSENMDNATRIGGLLSGMMLGMFFRDTKKQTNKKKRPSKLRQ